MKILVFIQVDDNNINRMSLETLACGQNLSDDVTAITFKQEVVEELSKYKVNEVLHVNNEKLSYYNPLSYAKAMESLISEYDIFLFAHTYETRDWVPRLSARFDLPFISDCINVNSENNLVSVTRQSYQGKINNDLAINGKAFLSIQSGCYKTDLLKLEQSNSRNIDIDLNDVPNTIRAEEKFKEQKGGVDLTSADLIVSVGRGIAKEENIPLAEELTNLLNAELGSSRPIVDYGWLPHDRQIGSSGQVVSPKLYFSLGVSGAIQHQVGMKGSDKIMAINKDGNAPIFEIADYAIVGDLLEIVPKMISKLKD